MKKILAALTATFYLYGFVFCLCYAAVMGEVHPAASATAVAQVPAQSDDEHGECSHHDQENEHGQAHHDQPISDVCCIKFLQDTPGLLPELSAKPLSIPYSSLHLLPTSTSMLDVWQNAFLFRNHSPPGLALRDPLLSPLSPRAPPFPA